MKSIFILLGILFFSLHSQAKYKGTISFSQEEINYHYQQSKTFNDIAARCLMDYKQEHLDFYYNNCKGDICLSKFYGERRYSKKKNAYRPDGTPLIYLGNALDEIGFPRNYIEKMQSTSCIGMTLNCLKTAFLNTNQSKQWEKIRQYVVVENDSRGTVLQKALRHLGWKVYYWNPSPVSEIYENMKRWDEEEKNWQSKGHHTYRYNSVMNKGTYWYNKVDNKTDLVGFDQDQPELLKQTPFWVGTAHTGYHVFPGTFSEVVEAHSTRHITSVDNLEFSVFSPLVKGGGPKWTKTEKYRSGLIAIPPL